MKPISPCPLFNNEILRIVEIGLDKAVSLCFSTPLQHMIKGYSDNLNILYGDTFFPSSGALIKSRSSWHWLGDGYVQLTWPQWHQRHTTVRSYENSWDPILKYKEYGLPHVSAISRSPDLDSSKSSTNQVISPLISVKYLQLSLDISLQHDLY